MRLRTGRLQSGFTFVENLVAVSIVAVGFTALYALNSATLYLLNSAAELTTAKEVTEDRMEQVRNSRWSQVTDSSFIRDNVLNNASTGFLGSMTETITVSGYPEPTSGANPSFTVTRVNGAATVSAGGSAASAFSSFDLARVDVTVTWTASPGRRTRTTSTSTIWGENSR